MKNKTSLKTWYVAYLFPLMSVEVIVVLKSRKRIGIAWHVAKLQRAMKVKLISFQTKHSRGIFVAIAINELNSRLSTS